MSTEVSALGRPFSQTYAEHSGQLLEQLNVQRYYGVFTDIVVRVNDIDFKLHKCLLAACSSKFQAMLFGLRQECGNLMTLKEISVTGFRCIVDYIYTGTLKMDSLYAQDVLVAAQFLELRDVEKVVLEFFKNIGSDAPMPPTEAALSLMRMSQGVGLVSNSDYHQPVVSQEAQVAPPAESVVAPEQQQQQPELAVSSYARTPLPSLPQTWPVHLPTTVSGSGQVPMYPSATYDGSCFEEYLKIIESFQGQADQGQGGAARQQFPRIPGTLKDIDPYAAAAAAAAAAISTLPSAVNAPPALSATTQMSAVVPSPVTSEQSLQMPPVTATAAASATAAQSVEDKPLVQIPLLPPESQEDAEEDDEDDEDDDYDDDGVSITEEERQDGPIPRVETVLLKLKKPESFSYEVVKPPEHVSLPAPPSVQEVKEEERSTECSVEQTINKSHTGKEIAIQTSSASYIRRMKKRFRKFTGMKKTSNKMTAASSSVLSVPSVVGKRKRGRPPKKADTAAPPLSSADVAADTAVSQTEESDHDDDDDDDNMDGDYIPEGADSEIDNMEIKNKPLKKRLREEKMDKKRPGRKKKDKRVHDCPQCGRQFGKQEALRRHVDMHEKIPMYSCHMCGQKYVRPTELTQHMRSHTAETYICNECNLEYKDPRLYKKHMVLKHLDSKPFRCNFVDCTFSSNRPSNVDKHAVIHSGMKTYGCPNCGKCFAQPNGLQSHMKSCYQRRGYLCDFCGQKFNYLQSMKSHRLLHTGEKPHICPDCGARFADQRNFKRHRRIHENTYPYSCTYCDKHFRHSNSLKAHLNIHRKHELQSLRLVQLGSGVPPDGTQPVKLQDTPSQNTYQDHHSVVNLPPPQTPTPTLAQLVQQPPTPHPTPSPMPLPPVALPGVQVQQPQATLSTSLASAFPMSLQGHLQSLQPVMQGSLQVHHMHGAIPMNTTMTVSPAHMAHMLPLHAAYETVGMKYMEKIPDAQTHVDAAQAQAQAQLQAQVEAHVHAQAHAQAVAQAQALQQSATDETTQN